MDQIQSVRSYTEFGNAPEPPTDERPRSFMQWVLYSYRQHWVIMLVLTLIAALGGGVYTYFGDRPTYTASMQVVVESRRGDQTANLGIMTTVANLYFSNESLDYANKQLDHAYSLRELQTATVCVPTSGSLLLTCSVTLPSASDARRYLQQITKRGKEISEREFPNVVIGGLSQVVSVRRDAPPYLRNIGMSAGVTLFLLLVIVPFLPIRVRKVSKHQADRGFRGSYSGMQRR